MVFLKELFDRLLITFGNSLNPDYSRQDVGPDLEPNCLTLMVFLKELFDHLLITFANSLNPDHARKNVWPDPDPNCLTP